MTKIISLTQYKVTEVSDEDFEDLNQHKWCAAYDPRIGDYYAVRNLNVNRKIKTIYMHREIVKKKLIEEKNIDLFVDFISNPRRFPVDHKDHNTLKNIRENIRIVSPRQNQQNQRRKSSSKYPGVYWNTQKRRWHATITINDKRKHLGFFGDEREAAKAYEKACRERGEELICKVFGGI